MTEQIAPLKKVKRKIKKSQNPLFEKWLKEWKEEAGKNGSEMQYCFSRALKSLQKFPLKLYSGKECIMLENFGAKICKMLDERLDKYKTMHPEDTSLYPKSKTQDKNSSFNNLGISLIIQENSRKRKSSEVSPPKKLKLDSESGEGETKTKLKTKSSSYVPGYRSGPYAILISMLEKSQENDYKGFMTKAEIQKSAQAFCDTSFTKPLPGSYYTAWNSMGVLLKKDLVHKEGNPTKYSLTDAGLKLAKKLNKANAEEKVEQVINVKEAEKFVFPAENLSPLKIQKSPTKAQKSPVKEKSQKPKASPRKTKNVESETEVVSEPEETIFLMPGTFEIKLLVDTQERDDKFQQSSSATMKQLKSRNVNFEIRHLKVGDFVWIAKDIFNGHELVLPYVVERKRMDDLASSIKDGRFHEQKFRLKQSGVENLIYLVEKYGNENQRLGLPYPTLLQAISNTQVINGFNVKITNNHDDSMRYLDVMTTQLSNVFKDKTLMSCKKSNIGKCNLSEDLISLMTFKEFSKGSEKNKKATVRSMLVKHLLQLNGVSLEKAKAIVQLYPTPKALIEGLNSGGEKSIADLSFGPLNRSIGSVVAKHIHMLYTSIKLQ